MGLGIGILQLKLELYNLGYFKNFKKVVEMGSQELHLKKNDFKEMIKMANINNYDEKNFKNLDNWPDHPRCSSKSLYKMLGFEDYYSLDLNEEQGSIAHDYNLEFKDTKHYSKYDLVTDYGSTTGAFNIAEAYKTIHNLCKKNGLIIVVQPLWKGTGFYLFDETFLNNLAASNNYNIINSYYLITLKSYTEHGSQNQFAIPMNSNLLDVLDLNKIVSISIYGVLEKTNNEEFKFLYQNGYLIEKSGAAGFNRIYYKDPPSYSYIPEFDKDFKNISGKVLLKKIIKRIKDKFLYILKFKK